MDRSLTVAFTGHRHYDGEADDALCRLLQSLYDEGYRTFLSGMAVGFDLAAGEAVVELRKAYSDVRLVAVVPFVGQERRFSAHERVRYERLLEQADERVVLAPHFRAGCYQVRNHYLIDHASVLVAWYDGSRGGTQYTFLRALHCGLRIENLGAVRLDPTLF